jgi:hypothetical protein
MSAAPSEVHGTIQPGPLSLGREGPFVLDHQAKPRRLLPELNRLTHLHYGACPEYRKLIDALYGGPGDVDDLNQIPMIPVRLFKHFELLSVPRSEVVRAMTSSGTSGQSVSKIYLDKATSALQTRALSAIVASFIGKQRLPMLVIDSRSTVTNRGAFSARTAGILGFSLFGRNVTYALDDEMQIDLGAISAFMDRHGHEPILIFGFTSIIWQHLVLALESQARQLALDNAILIHGGGWKKLASLAISAQAFRERLQSNTGIHRIHNYYGMVEQTGSIFLECEAGALHASDYSDVLFRHPVTFRPVTSGEPGLIHLLSTLPHSYPGHSILTEDLGISLGDAPCSCGRHGRRFQVLGRIKDAETRGCSDTYDAVR